MSSVSWPILSFQPCSGGTNYIIIIRFRFFSVQSLYINNCEINYKKLQKNNYYIKKKGLCKYIGVTGYPLGPLKEVVTRSNVKIDCVLTYSRLSLNDSSLMEYFEFFKSRIIITSNYCAALKYVNLHEVFPIY